MTTRNTKTNTKLKSQPEVEQQEQPASTAGSDPRPELVPDRAEAQSRPADPSASDAEVERLRAERESLRDRLARQQADFENSRKRAAREQQAFKDFALAEALKSLLPVLDSLDRALQTPALSVDEFRSGVELIRRQWLDAMIKLGLAPIPAKGERFDPNVHEAIETVETTEAEDRRVLEDLHRGYSLGGRLLRPARVRVARNPGTR